MADKRRWLIRKDTPGMGAAPFDSKQASIIGPNTEPIELAAVDALDALQLEVDTMRAWVGVERARSQGLEENAHAIAAELRRWTQVDLDNGPDLRSSRRQVWDWVNKIADRLDPALSTAPDQPDLRRGDE